VICHGCGGSGADTVSYKPYTGRKRKRNVQEILTDSGLWMVRSGNEKTISIKDFYDKVPEAEKE